MYIYIYDITVGNSCNTIHIPLIVDVSPNGLGIPSNRDNYQHGWLTTKTNMINNNSQPNA